MPHTASPHRAPTRHRSIDPEQHLGLVFSIAVKLYRRMLGRVELDELVGFGTEGLLEAAARFDASRGAAFSTFAYPRIRGAMLDGARKLSSVPVAIYRRGRDIEMADHIHVDEPVPSLAACAVEPDFDDQLDRAEQIERLEGALAELPDVQRHLVVQHHLNGVSLHDASRELGISKSWGSRQHARALATLREALATA
jgi:RNA polymerase sigma factor for flagellar operon FliA